MTTDSHAADTPLPRMFGQSRYVLPKSVQTNISREHYHGAPGLWAYARGVLIETCHELPWTPHALFVGVETDSSSDDTTAVVLTIVAQNETADHNKDVVTVVWRQDYGAGVHGRDIWQLTINGVVHRHPGSTNVRPSPPILATIIRDAING